MVKRADGKWVRHNESAEKQDGRRLLVINGQRITPESLGDILDIIGENESVLRAHVPGRKGDRCKKKKKLSLKVVHETLDELIYFLEKQKKIY